MNISVQPTPTISFPVESFAQHLVNHHGLYVSIESTKLGYALYWADGVANDWVENYDTLSALLLRLAVLIECADGNKSFASDNDEFQQIASDFLRTQAV
jgi:hypothetical protein